MLKIFIPSYNRAAASAAPLSTAALLQECGVDNYKLVVRRSQQKEYLLYHNRNNLLVLPNEGDLTVAREYTRQLVKLGEWCLHMDDNIRGFIMPKGHWYFAHDEVPLAKGETMITRAKWQATMNVRVSFANWYEMVVEDTIAQADKRGANLCGFSAHENPAFRAKKFTDVGYVCGKAMLLRNAGLPWKQSKVSAGEDYALTAAHLYEDGRVLINKWGHPLRVHYQPGGCGPYLERLPQMLAAQQELLGRYGSLLRIKNANNPEAKQGELALRFNSLEQVAKWREAFSCQPNYIALRSGKLREPLVIKGAIG